MDKKPIDLVALHAEVIAKYPAKTDPVSGAIISTFCNYGVDDQATAFGYNKFHISRFTTLPNGDRKETRTRLTADAIMEILQREWLSVPGDKAAELAYKGVLVIAGMSSTEIRAAAVRLKKLSLQHASHGHVAGVSTSPMLDSGSWGKKVPVLANVGPRNGFLKASSCFPAEPRYFYLPGGQSVA